MSTQYYYLVASLPGLSFASPAALTKNDFIEACRHQLTAPDFAELEALLAGRHTSVKTSFSRMWFDADVHIRNALVRQRAQRLGVDDKKYFHPQEGYRMDADIAVSDAYARSNPLERELALDRFRWKQAESLCAGDPFGLPSLLAYGVMLAIHERWQPLTPEQGKERLEDMVGMVGVSADELAGWGGLAQL